MSPTGLLVLSCALAVAQPPAGPSEAERVAKLEKAIEASEKQLAGIKKELDDPQGEFHEARVEYQELENLLEKQKKEAARLRAGGKTAEAVAIDQLVADVQKEWQSARDRFELAYEERKAMQEKEAALNDKLKADRQELDRLMNAGKSSEGSIFENALRQACDTKKPGANGEESGLFSAALHDAAKASGAPGATTPAGATGPAGPTGATTPAGSKGGDTEGENKRLAEAREQMQAREAEAKAAQDKAKTVAGRLATLQKNVDLEQRLFNTARKRADLAQQTRSDLEKELQRKREAKAAESELSALQQKIWAATQRYTEASAEVQSAADRLTELQTELSGVQAEQIAALREAEDKRKEADDAANRVKSLQNPFTPVNIAQWFLDHGPKLLVIVLATFLLQRLVRFSGRRIVNVITRRKSDVRADSADRAETLVSVFRNAMSFLILTGGALMLLDEVGIPIVPLMGGAAVLGLAVAFGAQNLVRDYFAGFMVLMEDQYAVNDVVRINNLDGKVERITLRMTVLRDQEGAAHFIPHGTITTVTNMTHSWSRAFFTIGVAYKEDADRVMDVLLGLGREMQEDPIFGPLILEEPEMLGVDSFGDSAVMIKFFMKTRPLKQWDVKREMLRRIKRRFDELGIEIPFPHQTIYHRGAGPVPHGDMGGHAA